jgi:hypothetical protein
VTERRVSAAELEPEVRALLAAPLEPRALVVRLEALNARGPLGELTNVYGPVLYARDPVVFGPFILQHFTTYRIEKRRWRALRWKDDARALDAWLEAADARDDVASFRRLWTWKHGADKDRWREELRRRHARAVTSPERAAIRERYAHLAWGALDEALALELFRADPAASTFIREHVPVRGWFGAAKTRWKTLEAEARQARDEALADALYRALVSPEELASDLTALAQELGDPAALCAALERRTPRTTDGLAELATSLLERRGADVAPWIAAHVGQLRSWRVGRAKTDPVKRLADLAHALGHLPLWATILRGAASDSQWNEALRARLDAGADDAIVTRELDLLAGVGLEWNGPGFGVATIRALDDATAVRFYERFPALLRGRWRASLVAGWNADYPRLVDRLIAADDATLLDLVASRLATRDVRWMPKGSTETLDLLAAYYEGLRRDEATFARRATAVLGQVPAFAVAQFDRTIDGNRLGRLFFLRAARGLLGDPRAITELLEAPNIYVQRLAFVALGLDDPRAGERARENLPMLLATLLRPLHRRTRLLALRALERAAEAPEAAARVVARARQALALPEKGYPREALYTLIARVVARHPSLAGPREQRVVYRRAEERA